MRRDLDYLFELWALWVRNGCNARSGFASMLEMMMVTRCQFSGGGGAPNDSLETSIEGAVTALTLVDAPRDKSAHFREINGTAAAFQYLQKNYNPIASSFSDHLPENTGRV